MVEFKLTTYENYDAVENDLSDIVEINKSETQAAEESDPNAEVRPLYEICTDGEEFWFWDSTEDLNSEVGGECYSTIAKLVFKGLFDRIVETHKKYGERMKLPRFYTVSEEGLVESEESGESRMLDDQRPLNLTVEGSIESALQNATEAYEYHSRLKSQRDRHRQDAEDVELEEGYARGLRESEKTEFENYLKCIFEPLLNYLKGN